MDKKRIAMISYRLLILKRKLEDLFIRLFVVFGRDLALKNPLQEEYDIYFLFPFYHTGGAEKVHASLAAAFKGKKCVVLFTRRSGDDGFKSAFQNSGHRILDISAYTDNKRAYWKNLIWRGVVSAHINRQKKRPVVINGQCNFAYKLSPWINPNIVQIELVHSYNSFSDIRLPFISFYTQTVMISKKAIADHAKQYTRLDVPLSLLNKITYIANGIEIPVADQARDYSRMPLRVLYAGRGTAEKRVHIVARMSVAAKEKGISVFFSFVGDIQRYLEPGLQEAGGFYGLISDPKKMHEIFEDNDIVIITSSEEGFPMVIMEAMAAGCIILATPVGDIPAHVAHGVHGFLFSTVTDESAIISEAMDYFRLLVKDSALRENMSDANRRYARENFSMERFNQQWQQLVNQSEPEL